MKLHKLIFDLPSNQYHSTVDTFSSSQFKDLLDDEGIFIKKYIDKSIAKEENEAFDVGNYFHTGILEPQKLKSECAVYPGSVRKGREWDKFKAKHSGRLLLTKRQSEKATMLMGAVRDSPVAMSYVKRGKPEVSLFIELLIYQGEIYSPHFGKKLTKLGWVTGSLDKSEIKKATRIVVKVRADSLGLDFILDLKSTSGNARSVSSMKDKINYYNYDLSASLYLDMFTLVSKSEIKSFLWTFASKDYFNSKTYAASPSNITIGRIKYMGAILKLADCMRNEWHIPDSLGILEPHHSQLHYLQEKETDLL